ncbi:carboxypeptidase-like regulatory domain-containing protein [Mucilaginibacter polytrichastri]|uniref:Carboxypeptidase-like regulatory domain-containing protein n=1 Tax=Mucilaginibacter polytrichastri TaxID=1302689 RepID=A0A1Q5ZW59_9SPHI|nr:carboxypeptidase-like regulatory domain-containing protein [Mucilaginibacter polytrichastri]OKS86002.1 hypothetical protein RG47T_1449 [Mucilaginibacter polytrichastri]SFS59811.1 CarboxypepD_reg-like domain-containing protein [Mucilaginibacter polytrichastri]
MARIKTYPTLLIIIFTLVFLSIRPLMAQDRNRISGTVLSAEGAMPVDGVTIAWLNKGIGSITNSEGHFIIVLTASYAGTDSLTFSCIGYSTEKFSIGTAIGTNGLVVKLKPLVENLKEVVVRPLSLKQLLDSITQHNNEAFASPIKMNGYYRELVFTNDKCTEFSDAICAYFFDRVTQPDGQLKIIASRCRKETKENKDKDNMEVYKDSKINPNQAFSYAMLTGMIEKYFPEKSLADYQYTMQQQGSEQDLKIVILPKTDTGEAFYQLTLMLKGDFTLKSYRLEIPERLLGQVKEKSLLGIHIKVVKNLIEVNYLSIAGHIYPGYYSVRKLTKLWGKFLGTTINQLKEEKSEFVTGNVVLNSSAFTKADVYKKGNLCSNGTAINDDLLKNYTIIKPTMKDSVAISALGN